MPTMSYLFLTILQCSVRINSIFEMFTLKSVVLGIFTFGGSPRSSSPHIEVLVFIHTGQKYHVSCWTIFEVHTWQTLIGSSVGSTCISSKFDSSGCQIRFWLFSQIELSSLYISLSGSSLETVPLVHNKFFVIQTKFMGPF